jgi:hypothetical protein
MNGAFFRFVFLLFGIRGGADCRVGEHFKKIILTYCWSFCTDTGLNGDDKRMSSDGEFVSIFEFLQGRNSFTVNVSSSSTAKIQNRYSIIMRTDNTMLPTDPGTGRAKMTIFCPTDSECGNINRKHLPFLAFVCND